MISLYKKEQDSMLYAQCWVNDGVAVIYTGTLGQDGNTSKQDCFDEEGFMEKFIQEYTHQDYAEIAVEQQFQLVLQWPMKTRTGSNYNRGIRDRATEILNELLGWKGLGYVDGFDMGKSANPKEEFVLNIFCNVVDEKLALKWIMDTLPQQIDCSRLKIAGRKMRKDEYRLVYHAKEKEGWFYL